ncbi:hypothetical protein [Algoriphagus chordae]|nr:hypothetical protein [Algoriphagus chordae]
MVEQTTSTDQMMATVPQVDRSIFLEERDPSFLISSQETPIKKAPKGILEDLKSEDYYGMGKRDGYDDHELTLMEMHVDIIASRFKEVFHKALEDIEERIAMMGMYLTPEFEAAMPEQHELVHTKHDLLVKQRRELSLQLDLAVTGEGYIEKSVRYYKAGFRKGMALHLEEKVLFHKPKFQ